ncbi:MAG: LPS export ABC transporter permease LptG [Rhodospirillaceae bacterium]|nr:LPS export ABC transporter permease LptG [Rhodospirillaceae bacterium]MBT6305406.1 LPS export ABC transporter permease LptG [Rhodospirillaceae bacterium]MBT7730120.1 LPS export ABC transporter permease LptG [Rhodospirillaceae bacterium]
MRLSTTLSVYFGKQFFLNVAGMFLAIMAVVFLLDMIELFRRSANKDNVPISLIIEMAALKAPNIAQKIFPFSVLFGSMLFFIRVVRNHEYVAAKTAGVSIWQFLLPALLVVLFLGFFLISIFNPIASAMTAKYETIENTTLRNKGNALSMSSGGLWIREKTETGHSVLHTRDISENGDIFSKVTIFLFDNEDDFHSRIDAETAKLVPENWKLQNSILTSKAGIPVKKQIFKLPTQFTSSNIQDSFASPATLSFWDLPHFITLLEEAGFTAVRHRLHWHSLLASPLLLCAMVLIAANFSLRLGRTSGNLKWLLTGLFFGFFLYFMTDLVFALGLSSRIPEILAAWTPATVTVLLGTASLLHLEDG